MSRSEAQKSSLINNGLTSKLLGTKSILGMNSCLTKTSLLLEHKQSSILNDFNGLKRKINSGKEDSEFLNTKSKIDLSNQLLKSSTFVYNHSHLHKPNLSSTINHLSKNSLNTASIKTSSYFGKSNLVSSNLLASNKETNLSLMNKSLLPKSENNEIRKRAHDEENIEPVLANVGQQNDNDYHFSKELQEEYMQVESFIEFIDQQQESKREMLNKPKRFKRSDSIAFSDNSLHLTKDKFTDLQRQKNLLINLVSSSLLKQPNFKDVKDVTRCKLIQATKPIISQDPEFILKLALYTRRELNIRVTTNFLLCLAAFSQECRPYLTRYFKGAIVVNIQFKLAIIWQVFLLSYFFRAVIKIKNSFLR